MRAAFILVILTLAMLTTDSVLAQCNGRPCGTGPLALLTPQGHRGADFRPACSQHDACYDGSGKSRRECDREYYQRLQTACAYSADPSVCKRRARRMHIAVRLFGWLHYRR